MTRDPDARRTAPDIVLEPIERKSAPVLENLFELYAHDFSEYVPVEIGESGRFGVSPGAHWWTNEDHFPFFLRHDGNLVGFALVKRGSRVTGAIDVMDIAEFFVIRGARRLGVGMRAAHALFEAFPGKWEVRVRRVNVPATAFWERTLRAWMGRPIASEPFRSEDVVWGVFAVSS